MQIQKVERERAEIDNDKNVLDNKTENNVQRVREKMQRLDSKQVGRDEEPWLGQEI